MWTLAHRGESSGGGRTKRTVRHSTEEKAQLVQRHALKPQTRATAARVRTQARARTSTTSLLSPLREHLALVAMQPPKVGRSFQKPTRGTEVRGRIIKSTWPLRLCRKDDCVGNTIASETRLRRKHDCIRNTQVKGGDGVGGSCDAMKRDCGVRRYDTPTPGRPPTPKDEKQHSCTRWYGTASANNKDARERASLAVLCRLVRKAGHWPSR